MSSLQRSLISRILKTSYLMYHIICFIFIFQTVGIYTMKNNNLMNKLIFTKSCPEENYRFHNATGNFLCVVPTAKICFELCQKLSCNEWYYMSFIPSGSNQVKHHHRCRCFPEYHFCFYNPVPRKYRDFY
ncbi:hypothetical protein EWB00_002860 [Schistosoma japonicum]|uniref:Uncharacterized protein n=1 Tax=Schistosoma japonicum TaxID=6182 RepID=A0A4Z2DAF7_SCHJA|nr:hypothetical protein KSF78_0002009 [Schistosoma japonicum]TNN13487.1 hypothetical protein EWB00_002860 [Schistosoma japonicum]